MNEKQITKFVTESYPEQAWGSIESMFRRFDPYEIDFDKPLHQFNNAELQDAVNHALGKSTTMWTKIDALRKYISWCKKNGVEGVEDSVFHLDESSLEEYKLSMVSGPLQLQAWLNEIFPPEYLQTVDNVYRGYIWLGFSGFDDSHLGDILRTDVDFDAMVIRFDDDTYPIYLDAVPTLTNLVSCDTLVMTHYGNIRVRPRATGDKLLSGIGIQEFDHKNVRSAVAQRVARAIKEGRTRRRINYRKAALSGLFYRIYRAESIITGPVQAMSIADTTLYELARTEVEACDYKPLLNYKDTSQFYLDAKYKSYKEQYIKWKTVFYT